MKINIKKLHPDAKIPEYAKLGDAGVDLTAVSKTETELYIEYDTGLAFEIEEGFVGLLFPRSSVSNKHLILANAVGVIDSGFRGSVTARFKKTSNNTYQAIYNVGDRVVQLIILPYPKVEFVETAELLPSQRGTGGYGSSGN